MRSSSRTFRGVLLTGAVLAAAIPLGWTLARSGAPRRAPAPAGYPAARQGASPHERLTRTTQQLEASSRLVEINRMEHTVAAIEREVVTPWRDAWLRRDADAFARLLADGATVPAWSTAPRTPRRDADGLAEHTWELTNTQADRAEAGRYLNLFTRIDAIDFDVTRAETAADRATLDVRFDLRGRGAGDLRREDHGVFQVTLARANDRWKVTRITAPAACESVASAAGRQPAYEDVTARVGLGSVPRVDRREALRRGGYAIASADYDGDGRPDLLVGNWGPVKLYRNTPAGFVDATAQAGLREETLVKAAAFADMDNDGRRDLILLRYVDTPAQPNDERGRDPMNGRAGDGDLVAYRNLGDGRFEHKGDVLTRRRHYDRSMPLAVADFDGNGTLDLYVGFPGGRDFTNDLARTGAQEGLARQGLWLNDGHWNFTETPRASDLTTQEGVFPHAALATDFTGDAKPEILVIDDSGRVSPMYRNEGDGRFTDATRAMGLDRMGWGMGAAAGDFDGDGRTDLVLTSIALAARERIAHAWRGHDLSALPAPVREELTTLGEQGVFLFRAKGDGTFEDVTARAGVRWAGAGPAGAEWVDYNHDGRLDLYVANGLWSGGPENIESLFARVVDDRATRHLGLTPHEGTNETTIPDLLMSLPADAQRHPNPMLSVLREYRGTLTDPRRPPTSERPTLSIAGYQRNRLFRNNGDGTFTDVGYFEDADRAEDGYMTSVTDLDLDGRADLVLRNADAPPGYDAATVVALRNTREGRVLTVVPVGTRSNRDGIGARVTATVGDRAIVREVRSANGAIQGEPVVTFGLGDAARADAVEVLWPSGLRERFAAQNAGRVTLREGEGTPVPAAR